MAGKETAPTAAAALAGLAFPEAGHEVPRAREQEVHEHAQDGVVPRHLDPVHVQDDRVHDVVRRGRADDRVLLVHGGQAARAQGLVQGLLGLGAPEDLLGQRLVRRDSRQLPHLAVRVEPAVQREL